MKRKDKRLLRLEAKIRKVGVILREQCPELDTPELQEFRRRYLDDLYGRHVELVTGIPNKYSKPGNARTRSRLGHSIGLAITLK